MVILHTCHTFDILSSPHPCLEHFIKSPAGARLLSHTIRQLVFPRAPNHPIHIPFIEKLLYSSYFKLPIIGKLDRKGPKYWKTKILAQSLII